MLSKKKNNILISLGILTAWVCIVVILSALSNKTGDEISVVYIWTRLSGLLAGFGGLIFLALRMFKRIDRKTNLGYALFALANLALGLGGLYYYFRHTINVVGFHDLLPNLLIGVVMLTDLLLYDIILKD